MADWLQLGGGVERRVEQPVPANPPDSAATSEYSDYTHHTEVEVEDEEVTPGERASPGRQLGMRAGFQCRSRCPEQRGKFDHAYPCKDELWLDREVFLSVRIGDIGWSIPVEIKG